MNEKVVIGMVLFKLNLEWKGPGEEEGYSKFKI